MKKWIAVIMAIVVCLSLFTACKTEVEETQSQENVMAQPLLGEELEKAKDEIVGEWRSAEGILMWIYFEGDVCKVSIDRQVDDGWATWTFSGDLAKLDDYRLVANDCTKYLNSSDGSIVSVYENGIATLLMKDGKITWIDESEHEADDAVFERTYAE